VVAGMSRKEQKDVWESRMQEEAAGDNRR